MPNPKRASFQQKSIQEWILMIEENWTGKGLLISVQLNKKHSRVNHYDEEELNYKGSTRFQFNPPKKYSRVNHYD